LFRPYAQGSGKFLSQARDVRGELGPFEPNRGVNVHYPIASFAEQATDVSQKKEAGSVPPLG